MRNLFKTKDDEDIIYDPNDERLDFNILYLTHYYDPDKRVRQRSGRRAVVIASILVVIASILVVIASILVCLTILGVLLWKLDVII